MYEMTEKVCAILPAEKPRYLMGVGTPVNILECIALGIDMFDCVIPTRNGRNGTIYTSNGIMNMRNEKWKNDFSEVDEEGTSFVDRSYSKSYLRHLTVSNEMLAAQISTQHNLTFYSWLVEETRKKTGEMTMQCIVQSILPIPAHIAKHIFLLNTTLPFSTHQDSTARFLFFSALLPISTIILLLRFRTHIE